MVRQAAAEVRQFGVWRDCVSGCKTAEVAVLEGRKECAGSSFRRGRSERARNCVKRASATQYQCGRSARQSRKERSSKSERAQSTEHMRCSSQVRLFHGLRWCPARTSLPTEDAVHIAHIQRERVHHRLTSSSKVKVHFSVIFFQHYRHRKEQFQRLSTFPCKRLCQSRVLTMIQTNVIQTPLNGIGATCRQCATLFLAAVPHTMPELAPVPFLSR